MARAKKHPATRTLVVTLESARCAALELSVLSEGATEASWDECGGWIGRALREPESMRVFPLPAHAIESPVALVRYLDAQLATSLDLARQAGDTEAERAIEEAQRASEHAQRRERAASAPTVEERSAKEPAALTVGNAVVRILGDRAEIEIPDYGVESYRTLVTIKSAIPRADAEGRVVRCAASDLIALGIVPPSEIGDYKAPPALFEDQAYVVATALRRKRFAIFAEAGWGKTAAQLAWALEVHRATGGRVLLVAPLAVVRQTIRELAKHFPGAARIENLRDRKGGVRCLAAMRALDSAPWGGGCVCDVFGGCGCHRCSCRRGPSRGARALIAYRDTYRNSLSR